MINKDFLYNKRYSIIKEDIFLHPNRKFIPASLWMSSLSNDNLPIEYFAADTIVAGGMGFDKTQAKISALGEYMERYCAFSEFKGKDYINSKTRSDLIELGLTPVSIEFLNSFYSENQYLYFDFIREVSNNNDTINWVSSTDLITKKEYYIPDYLIYLGRSSNLGDKNFALYSNPSTGLSAGRCIEDAIEGGFLECAERHAFCEFWYKQKQRNNLSYDQKTILKKFNDNEKIIELFGNSNVSIKTFDLSDICSIPSFMVFIIFVFKGKTYQTCGCSSRFDIEEALIKACSEAYQGIELAIWLDKKYDNWKDDKDLSYVSDFHKHFAYYNKFPFLRKESNILNEVHNKKSNDREFIEHKELINNFNISEIAKKNKLKHIYTKDIGLNESIKFGFYVVKVIVEGWHQLSGHHNYPFLGSFIDDEDLFTEFPHPFP